MARQWSVRGGPIDQLLGDVFARPALPAPRLTANVYETVDADAFVIEIAVPGLRPEEITIEATSDGLTVSTHPQEAASGAERRYIERDQPLMPMSRVFEFPVEIDTDNIRATLEHGILRIVAPKAAAGRRRVIKVAQSA